MFKEAAMLSNGTLADPLTASQALAAVSKQSNPITGISAEPAGRLAEKVTIITGAATGIGRTMASVFAAEGAHVVVADLDGERGQKTATELSAEGWNAVNVTTDITSADQVQSLID